MVVTEQILSQIGPAVSSASSLLLYGKPGDGKTFLIESLQNLDTAPIYVPYALECQGNIVQLYDPIYHHRIEEEEDQPSVLAVSEERTVRPAMRQVPPSVHRQRRRTLDGHAGPALQRDVARCTRRPSS